MSIFDPGAYGSLFAELLGEAPLNFLGPGKPNHAARPKLASLAEEAAFVSGGPRDADMAACCRAALWLRYDFLDESHAISQGIDTPTGSYWHGFMHRREPDPGNARYWFRHVGHHPIFTALHSVAAELAAGATDRSAAIFVLQPAWDPFAFIDFCEMHRDHDNAAELLARRIQQREWELLFDYCYRQTRPSSEA